MYNIVEVKKYSGPTSKIIIIISLSNKLPCRPVCEICRKQHVQSNGTQKYQLSRQKKNSSTTVYGPSDK